MDPSLSPNQTPSTKASPLQKLIPRLKIANLMSLGEENFGKMVTNVEKNPLFKKYMYSENSTQRIFGYKKFPQAGISSHFMELNEEIARHSASSDIELILSEKKEMIALCKKIGVENFEKYFLYNEGKFSFQNIAKTCNISEEEASKTFDLINKVAVHNEFFQSEKPSIHSSHTFYSKIAQIEKGQKDNFFIKYNTLKYARGRYIIDYTKLKDLKKDLNIPKEEYKSLKKLIKTMELVNTRKSTINQIIELILDKQNNFFKKQNPEEMTDITQVDMAQLLGVHSSTVSRAISGKSIATPWNDEIPLKSFLIKGSVNLIKGRIADTVFEEEKLIMKKELNLPYRDEEIKSILNTKYQTTIATRTVAKYRLQMKISNVYERMKSYNKERNQKTNSDTFIRSNQR